jgi:RNA polymerase sigma-70 factor, ECF subfamily
LPEKENRVPIDSAVSPVLEADIIRRAQEGDAEAFGILFQKHKTRVYALCLRMTRNTAEAEDLTQDAFLHVFRKIAAFRADSALSTWLYRVTVNTVLMHFRKKSLSTVSVDKPNGNEQNGSSTTREFPSTDVRLAGCVDRVALNRALAELPNGYRRIFLLHEVGGYEHREIAEFLGCSVGNSKSQLHKARQRIRELLVRTVEAHGERPRCARRKMEFTPEAERWLASQNDNPELSGLIAPTAAKWVQTNAA